MVHYVETIDIDDERFITYCSEDDFNYDIKIGQKCKVILMNESLIIGTLYSVNDESFILQLGNGDNVEIIYSDINDIFSEEEIGMIN